MKGVIFTEFLSLVEEKFGLELSDQIIESSELDQNRREIGATER